LGNIFTLLNAVCILLLQLFRFNFILGDTLSHSRSSSKSVCLAVSLVVGSQHTKRRFNKFNRG
jgi:hypothetical protein